MNSHEMRGDPRAAEFFEHEPLSIIDDIYNAANSYVHAAIDQMASCLHEPEDENAQALAEVCRVRLSQVNRWAEMLAEATLAWRAQSVEKVHALFQGAIDKNFDKLELYVVILSDFAAAYVCSNISRDLACTR